MQKASRCGMPFLCCGPAWAPDTYYCVRPMLAALPHLGRRHLQFQILESSFKSRAARSSAHNSHLNWSSRRKISHTNRGEFKPFQRTECLDGIVLANNPPPDRFCFRKIRHRRPVGIGACENYARKSLSFDELGTASHPVFAVQPDHEPRLIVERSIGTVDAGRESEVSGHGKVREMPVIRHIPIECLLPEIRLCTAANHDLFAGNL